MEEKVKKKYIKPQVTRIELDNTISLCMMSNNGHHTHPEHPPKPDKPFASPFQSPFN